MSTNEPTAGKVIGNVGTLDLRHATAESVAAISRIGNVGQILYTPETAHLVSRLNCGNIGGSLEVPEDARFISGQAFLNFRDASEPVTFVVSGQIVIEQDTAAEDIEKGVAALIFSGQILCPAHLLGAVSAKLREANGQLTPYDPDTLIRTGKVTIDDHLLNGLDDDTKLLVAGKIEMPHIVDDALLTRKLTKLQLFGKVSCREENAAALNAALDQRASSFKLDTIPAGFEPVDGAITLDADTLTALPGRKLYCTAAVEIAADLEPAALDAALDELRATRLLICPAALKGVALQKCDALKTKAVFYEGQLWRIDDDATLRASRFDYLDGQATLLVREELTIDANVEPQVLADRLHKVHNFGAIRCTPDQMGALEARMGFDEGELVDSTQEPEAPDDGIRNAGTLAL